MSAFSNLEYELFAPLSISYVLPEITHNLRKGESPDWWDEDNHIGIEVARAENKHIGYSKHFANTYLGKSRADIPAKTLESFCGYTMFDKSGKLFAAGDSKGLIDGDRHIRLAIEKAREKLVLLNEEHFHSFNKNCLFLYMTFSMLDEDETTFISEYSKLTSQYKERFNHVFLWAFDVLIHFDVDRASSVSYPFSDVIISELDSLTHSLKSLSDWGNGTDFCSVLNRAKQ